MRKRLILIALSAAAWAPLTAQAAIATGEGWEPMARTVQVTTQENQKPMILKATKQPGEPSYALSDPGGPGSGSLFESDPAIVIVASDTCEGSCHSVKDDSYTGVSGGDSTAGITAF